MILTVKWLEGLWPNVHCGIVDYDGWTISVREKGIGRNAEKMLDGTVKYNIPEE